MPDGKEHQDKTGLYTAHKETFDDKPETPSFEETRQRVLRIALDLPVMICAFDENGDIGFWNRQCERVTGFSSEEIVGGMDWGPLLFADGRAQEQFRKMWRDPDRSFSDREVSMRAKDGAELIISWSRIAADHPTEMWFNWGVGMDITQAKATSRVLAASESQLRDLLENAPVGINVAQDGILRYVNKVLAAMVGRQADEVRDRPFAEFIHPDDLPTVRQRHAQRQQGMAPPSQYPMRLVGADGGERWTELNTAPTQWQGKPATLNFHTDITLRRQAELSLKESEKRAQALAEATFEAVFFFRRGRCLETNLAACKMFGRSHDQITAMSSDELIVTIDGQPVEQYLRQGGGAPLPAIGIKADGSEFPLEIRAKTAEHQGGPVLVCVARDLTEQMRAQDRLRLSEAMVKGIVQAAPIGIGVLRVRDKIIQWANERLAAMTGFSENELKDMPAQTLCADKDEFDRISRFKDEAIAQSGVATTESRIKKKNGELFNAILSSASLSSEGLGEEAVFTVMDITQRKQAEQALVESEQRLRKMVDNLPLGAAYREGGRLLLNLAAERITGYSRSEINTIDAWFEKLYGHQAAQRRDLYERDRRAGFPAPRILPLRRADGSARLVEFAATSMQNAEVWLLRDVTEERKAEEERERLEMQLQHAQKMEALGTLAGGIAHDFNNILAAVVGYTELALEMDAEGASANDELRQVLRSAGRARDLVRQILTFSRRAEVDLRPLDLNHEVIATVKLLERTLPKMIEIRAELDSGLPLIMANATQIEQVLMNLASNATDAMPDGGILSIDTGVFRPDAEFLRLNPELKEGEYALLRVADTGHGMDDDAMGHIFDPFFTTKEVGKGTGLGLSTVYGIVKTHGGHVICQSQPNQGTVFEVYLPVADRGIAANFIQFCESAESGGPDAGVVLLVDDEEALRDVGSRMLSRKGYIVVTAASGEEALELYKTRREDIDVIVLDVSMPGMGGRRCLDEIKKINPSQRVVITSGYSRDGGLAQLAGDKADGFVAKPFRQDDLHMAVRRALS